jgi:hypothetical protein
VEGQKRSPLNIALNVDDEMVQEKKIVTHNGDVTIFGLTTPPSFTLRATHAQLKRSILALDINQMRIIFKKIYCL